jgi:PPP family 3-phenylpropionic acid transporter
MLLWASHQAYSAYLVPLAAQRGAEPWAVGVAIGLAIVSEAVAMLVTSRLVARFGASRILVAASASSVLRWSLLAVTTGTASFLALHALHGLTFGIFFPTLVAAVAARVPEHARQGAQGLLASIAFGLGGGLGAMIAGDVLDRTSAPWVWATQALLALMALGCAVVVRRRERESLA